jgi:hypothetical protein
MCMHLALTEQNRTEQKRSVYTRLLKESYIFSRVYYYGLNKEEKHIRTFARYDGIYRSRGIVPVIHNLGTRWRWVVSFKLLPLYLQEKSPGYSFNRRLEGEKCLFLLPGRESQTEQHTAWSLHRHYPASLTGLVPDTKDNSVVPLQPCTQPLSWYNCEKDMHKMLRYLFRLGCNIHTKFLTNASINSKERMMWFSIKEL